MHYGNPNEINNRRDLHVSFNASECKLSTVCQFLKSLHRIMGGNVDGCIVETISLEKGVLCGLAVIVDICTYPGKNMWRKLHETGGKCETGCYLFCACARRPLRVL